MNLTNKIKEDINKTVLCWLATANSLAEPNVSPKEIFCSFGDNKILIANIASPQSVSNIKENPKVCISLIDVFSQKGHKLKGSAKILDSSKKDYQEKLAQLKKLSGDKIPIKAIIEIDIEEIAEILAPSYWLFKDTTQERQIKQAMKAYGVRAE